MSVIFSESSMNSLLMVRSYVLWLLVTLWPDVQPQFHLYYTDWTSEGNLYYDCLRYKVLDDIFKYNLKERRFESPYQIIPYCIRPFSEVRRRNKSIEDNIFSQFTFEQLRLQQVSSRDLLSWSAPIDLIERYDEYLDLPSNSSARIQIFYKCTQPWFGTLCEYTFDSDSSFNGIVKMKFSGKQVATLPKVLERYEVTNLTCYIHLKCDRGPAPTCLDWREVCDGKIDCMGDGADEINCFELEINECEENEFRCHNGMCITENFFNDGPYNPECMDSTDEDNYETENFRINGFSQCYQDPGFRCEESDHPISSRFFACGDGQRSLVRVPDVADFRKWSRCANARDMIMEVSLSSYAEHPNLSYDCWFLLSCATGYKINLKCRVLCSENDWLGCRIKMKNYCQTKFVIFPQRPIIQGHVLFVYLTNKTIHFLEEEISMLPDYVCYDAKRCPFLPAVSTLDINGTTCRQTQELRLNQMSDIIQIFQGCLTVIGSDLDIALMQSSVYQCPGTNKRISKHRVLDGVDDCHGSADEQHIDACQWNDKHRFKCSSEDKCISRILLRDSVKNCLGGEDETSILFEQVSFQKLCNGYVHLSPILIDGFNETDETHCDEWPCNNQYTRCDGAWNCPNGADELNCIATKCPSDSHECVSPKTGEVICLPVHQAGDGIVDCLGSTDERAFCRSESPENADIRYRCWKTMFCVSFDAICWTAACPSEKFAGCPIDIGLVFDRLRLDRSLQFLEYEHFLLDRSTKTVSPSAVVSKHFQNLTASMPILLSLPKSVASFTRPIMNQNSVVQPEYFDIRRLWLCNRGILIYVGIQLTEHCLCPPSYFGDRCQFQSQRVSLTLQFSRICAPECRGVFGIVVTLIDQDSIIHSHEQLTYLSTDECEKKLNLNLLYRSRPKDMTHSYNVRIDAFNKINLIYHASWILPVKFLFLPVNRIAAHLSIPVHPAGISSNCSMFCGHGKCFTYINTQDQHFCRCDSGWSGANCTMPHVCDCSSGSKCLGDVNNRSICICSLQKFGPRCHLRSLCTREICKNSAVCISDDERVPNGSFMCLCPVGFSGATCELAESRILISFRHMEIPRSIKVHFITVQNKADPVRTLRAAKIPFDLDVAIVQISMPFHIIISQVQNEYFLAYIQANYTPSALITTQIMPSQRCPHVRQLFQNGKMADYPLLRRVKYYHVLCRERIQLPCFHDNETFMCLCNEERHANCFPFDFNETFTWQCRDYCKNGAQCLSDREKCPHSIMCDCADCFYGSRCQLTTKGFGFSLDAILGYQIRPRVQMTRQPAIVKISIALNMLMLVICLISGTLSVVTFKSKILRKIGCGQYLLAASIVSLFTGIIFSLKLWMLVFSQMSLIKNSTILRINCISIDFALRLGPAMEDWLTAIVAIERALMVMMGVSFDKIKSKRVARWVIIGILLIIIGSVLHDPTHRQLNDDQGEERTWCLAQYSSALETYNSIINMIHFITPFLINFLSAFIIIVVAARRHATASQQETYRQHLHKNFHQHKHLIISPIVLVLLSLPRLVISFMSVCMKSARHSSLYVAAYFISFIPPFLTFVVFVMPSELYMKQFYIETGRFRAIIRRNVHLV